MRYIVLFLFVGFLLSCQPDQEKKGISDHPRLLFSRNELPRLVRKARSPEGQVILNQLSKTLNNKPDALYLGAWAAGHGFLYTLMGDKMQAEIAWAYTEMVINDKLLLNFPDQLDQSDPNHRMWNSDYKAIYRLPNIIGVSLAYDLCYHVWDADFRLWVTMELEDKAVKLLKGEGTDWNPNPWSSWYGITKGAGGFALLSILNDPYASDSVTFFLEKAKDELLLHSSYLGEKGWTTEGFENMRYELCTGVLPFIQAYKHVTGYDLIRESENLKWFLPFFVMQSIPDTNILVIPDYGPSGIYWNTNRWCSGDFVMGMGSVPSEFMPAVLWTFDKTFGMSGDQSFNIYKTYDAIFALVNYPLNKRVKNPGKILPRVWKDTTGGYYVFRNQWNNKNDFVTTITSNELARPGSQSHKDAGSFRIFGLGGKWAVRGSGNRDPGNQIFENVVIVEEATNWRGGEVILFEEKNNGSGSISLDLSNTYLGGAKFEDPIDIGVKEAFRAFAVEYVNDSAAIFAICDRFTGGGKKTWQMFTGEEVGIIKQNQFVLEAHNGANLSATFILPEDVEITSSGSRIIATGGDEFYVVMTIQKGPIPEIVSKPSQIIPEIEVYSHKILFESGRISVSQAN